jgi:hypothetical protein
MSKEEKVSSKSPPAPQHFALHTCPAGHVNFDNGSVGWRPGKAIALEANATELTKTRKLNLMLLPLNKLINKCNVE